MPEACGVTRIKIDFTSYLQVPTIRQLVPIRYVANDSNVYDKNVAELCYSCKITAIRIYFKSMYINYSPG